MQTLLRKLKENNISIALDESDLKVRFNGTNLPFEVLKELKENKSQLIEYLTNLHKGEEEGIHVIPVNPDGYYSVTSAQRRLWVLSQFEEGGIAYNMRGGYILEGELDQEALSYAFSRLIERHEILRTVFRENELGDVMQLILPVEKSVSSVVCLDLREREQQQSVLKKLVQDELMTPFDLAAGPLIRASLCQLTDTKWVFTYVMHHIISDGWSMGILINELMLIYNAAIKEEKDSLAPLRIQYKDYALWLQKQLNDKSSSHRSYWLKQFSGEIPVLELAGDKVRPLVRTYNGGVVYNLLDKELTAKLRDFLRQEGATLFMGLLSAVNALLFRYTAQEDLIIGSPVAGRDHVDLEDQIGFYLNTLALRTQFKGEDTYRELLQRVKQITLDAYEHQIYPFEELVDELQLPRNMGRNPLFDVLIILQNTNIQHQNKQQSLGNVTISGFEGGEHVISKADLSFDFMETGETLQLGIEYNSDIFNRETIIRMSTHFEQLLMVMLNDPAVSLYEYDYLLAAEKEQLLLNDTPIAAGIAVDKTIIDLFDVQVLDEPEKVALVYDNSIYTYAELNEKSNRLANYLNLKYQIKPNDLVGIMLPRSEWMVLSILAVLKAGGAYVPIDPEYPADRVSYIVEDSKCKLVIDETELGFFLETADDYNSERIICSAGPGDLAYVIYTSGSTGQPKGVMIEHVNVTVFFENMKKVFGFTKEMSLCATTSFTFDISVLELLGTLVNGICIYLADSIESLDFLTEKKSPVVDALQITPSKLNQLLELDPHGIEKLKMLKVLLIGGEAWSDYDFVRLKELKSVKVINVYGPTETTIWSTSLDISESDVLSVGRPLLNERIYIVDKHGKLVPTGISGEICISGAGVARGYLNRPELTESKFVSDPFFMEGQLYKTGDSGRWLSDGSIEFGGRLDDQVKIRGYRIEPGEIEKAIRAYPGIDSVVVIARSNTASEKELVAYLVSNGEELHVSAIRSHLSAVLPAFMIPGYFVQLDQLPLTSNGKLDRKKLPDPANAGMKTGVVYLAPETQTEERLVSIWQSILEKEKIGILDSFFECGGNSLKATRLVSLLHKEFDVKLTLNEIFSNAVLRDQASLILRKPKVSFVSLKPVVIQENYALSSAQRRLWILSQFEESSVAYHMPGVYVFDGDVDISAIKHAFDELIIRHEILRTVFKEIGAEIRQVVLPAEELDFKIVFNDLRKEKHGAEKAELLVQSALNSPFDLSAGPLIRAALYQLSDHQWIFSYTMHHIISDGWSMVILINEFLQLYSARLNKRSYSPAALRIQYKDYAAWQQEQLSAASLNAHKSYWLKQFEGNLPVLELPADNVRPAVKTYNGNILRKNIETTDINKFMQLLDKHESTLFMGLTAMINLLFYRYTGQEDIIIGSPAAGRDHIDLENQIGFYLNMLALRTRFKGSGDFVSLLEEVKKTTLDAYEHQIYPFDELVDELQLKRDLSRSALFDVMVILQNFTHGDSHMADHETGFKVSVYGTQDHTVSKYDLTFNFTEQDGALAFDIEYNTNIFDRETVNRLADHFVSLLKEVTIKPSVPMPQLEYLTDKEKIQLLELFNVTAVTLQEDENIVDLFRKQVLAGPENTAVVFEGKEYTYHYLDDVSDRLACYLNRIYQTQSGDLIGIQLGRSEWLIIAILGIMKSTAAYIPIDPEYPEERLAYIINDSKCKAVLDETVLSDFRASIDTDFSELEKRTIPANSTAYCIYTSGTTGNPKGCLLSHKNVVNFFTGMTDIFGREPGTMLSLTNYTFDISVLELVWTLTLGYKVVIQREVRDLISSDEIQDQALEFSLFYFGNAEPGNDQDKYRLLLDGAKFADNNDFVAVWTPERHFHEFGGLYPNPSVLGAALSTITKNISIRAGSVVIPLHHPLRIAEEWSVIDNLSGGRVGVACASGWNANDFVLSPEKYVNRHEEMYGAIDTIQRLWQGESIPYEDGNGTLKQVSIFPRPVSKALPLWITSANSIDTFISAGKKGFNILTHLLGETVEGLAIKIAAYRKAYAEYGHDISKAKVALMLHTYIGEDIESTYAVAKRPFINYLKTSAGLIRNLAADLNMDIDDKDFTEQDMDTLLEHSFNRYASSASLVGTKATCSEMLSKLSRIGVTEIACLIDFGVDYAAAMKGLEQLTAIKTIHNSQFELRSAGVSAFNQIQDHQVTHLQATPSMVNLIQAQLGKLNSIKTILIGGERLPLSLVKQLYNGMPAIDIYNMYGPTETTIWSTCWKVNRNTEKILIGKPIANTKLYILDQDLNLLPIGAAGELYIGGSGVAQGYLNNPDLSAERFTENLFCPGERVYRTGDFAKWLPDGNMEYIGRKDDQVKVYGHRIELGEIESVLQENKLVTGAAVLIIEGLDGEKELVAYVVGTEKLNLTDLRTGLSAKLPEYMVPGHYIQIEYLPLTPNGKVDKKKLPELGGHDIDTGTAYVEPENDIERKLVLIWQEVLNRDKIGVNDNFFELGGHSLKAIRVLSRMKEDFKINFRIDELFNNLTIKTLAMEIKRKTWAIDNGNEIANDQAVII